MERICFLFSLGKQGKQTDENFGVVVTHSITHKRKTVLSRTTQKRKGTRFNLLTQNQIRS
ncbi:hypothetical protein Hanom_Chr01g00082791 [Helianthus anomalus]